MRLIRTTLCLLLASLGGLAAGPAAAAEPPAVQSARISELLRQGQRREALPLARQYVAARPDDGLMAYNLACLENTDGDPERALAAFAAALAAGFEPCGAARTDPDLQGPIQARLEELCATDRSARETQAGRQGLRLDRDQWSAARELVPAPGQAGASRPRLRLRWHEDGLELELAAAADWADWSAGPALPPWHGGPGLLVSLGIADDGAVFETDNHFLFAFGREGKGVVGGLYVATRKQWQRVQELDPALESAADRSLVLTATIPWSALAPYDPVIDTPLGLNAMLRSTAESGAQRAWLVPTLDLADAEAPRRRFAPLAFNTDSITDDRFLGRLDSSLSSRSPLNMDLVAVSSTAGEATLSLNFMDQAGRSVLPEGPLRGSLPLRQGTNLIARQADFSALKNGAYLIEAQLDFPSGSQATWQVPVLQLAPGWQDHYRERIAYVALAEQATADYLLAAITAAVRELPPRRNPGAIVTSLIDLDRLLAAAEESGTILPEKGFFAFVYPGPNGDNRLCHLYLPAGRLIADGVNPVLVLGRGGGGEARLAARIGQNYEQGKQNPTLKTGQDDRFPVYLVPELGAGPIDLMAEADACRRWAMAYFRTPAVAVAGIDELGWTGIQLAGRVPEALRGVLVLAGRGLEPWPQAQPEFIRRQLGPAPADLPLTWIDFGQETRQGGQARQILQALQAAGYRINAEETVRGALNLTQVADRVVLWAEGLR